MNVEENERNFKYEWEGNKTLAIISFVGAIAFFVLIHLW